MTTETKTAAELAAEAKSYFDTKHDTVKAIAEEALGKAAKGEELSTSVKQLADEALTGMNEAKARLDDLEQKVARKGVQADGQAATVGAQFIESEDVKSFLAAKASRGRVSMETKAIISSLTTDANGSAGDLLMPTRVPGIVAPNQRRLTVRDLLTPGRTDSNSVQYVKETGFTNSAATVSETAGTTKPQSEIKFDIATSNVTTIAHWVQATRQILDDASMLQSYIDGRLRYGLALVEENQLLNGGGTGTDLNGIYTQAAAFSAPITIPATVTKVDVIRLALLQASLAEFPSTGIVMHPSDWATIELLKDTAGAYLIGNPQGTLTPTLWGLPLVATQAMTIDKYLVGAFQLGAQIFDRWDARVEVSTEDDQNFRKNLVTILAEERLALAVYRPEAFIKGDFSDNATSATAA